MFKNITPENDDGRIGSDNNIHEGIGTIKLLLDLPKYLKSPPKHIQTVMDTNSQNLTQDCTCARCGYDRGIYLTHTEVEGFEIECRNCGTTILQDK